MFRRIKPFFLVYRKYKDYKTNKLFNKLSRFKTTDQLFNYAKEQNYMSFLIFFGLYSNQGAKFESLFNYLKIGFSGINFLDLGPGVGDSLDIATERGALANFIDYNPYFFWWNKLKGYGGLYSNFLLEKGLKKVVSNSFDLILSRGSINIDRFNRKEKEIMLFDVWLEKIENLTRIEGTIIICPTFDKGNNPKKDYICKDHDKFFESWAFNVLMERDYDLLFIAGFNDTLFPFTFIKRREEKKR